MAEYESDGEVRNDPYCMGKSWQAENVKSTNAAMGYHNMADLANAKAAPVSMVGAKENKQLSPELPGENDYNYDKNR